MNLSQYMQAVETKTPSLQSESCIHSFEFRIHDFTFILSGVLDWRMIYSSTLMVNNVRLGVSHKTRSAIFLSYIKHAGNLLRLDENIIVSK